MKKLLLAIALTGLSINAMAQDEPVRKFSVLTNSFWSNWYVQSGASWNAFYSNEEHGQHLKADPFADFRSTPGFSIALGKWFTPTLGLRAKFGGVWAKQVTDGAAHDVTAFDLQTQGMLNFNNLFCGYNPSRVWSLSWFGGGGFVRNCSDNGYGFALSTGLHSAWKVSDRVGVYLEGGLVMAEPVTDGVSVSAINPKHLGGFWNNHDNKAYAEVGVTFNIGRHGWDKSPDVDAINALHQVQIDALNAQLNDAYAENERLERLLKAAQKPVTQQPVTIVKQVASTPVSVFFKLGKTKIAVKKDLVAVRELADYAKGNNSKIVVTGYADSATGDAAYNRSLSERRADVIAGELIKMGIERENIMIVAEGGVDTLSPASYNRRATVKIVE